MRISAEETKRIAALAHLELDDAAVARFSAELSVILDYVDQLNEVDISAGPPLDAALATPLRDDEPAPSLATSDVERNAPRFAHGHFVVPKVIGGEP